MCKILISQIKAKKKYILGKINIHVSQEIRQFLL